MILGIETSCDETAAAVVEETGDPARPWAVRSNVVASQVEIHREWGGVVPELASRQHVRDICGVVERALDRGRRRARRHRRHRRHAGARPRRLAARRRVVREGARRRRAACRSCPCIISPATSSRSSSHNGELPLPAVRARRVGRPHEPVPRARTRATTSLLGRTRDDAAGEAYDKVAKLLGLGYPGGPAIDRRARARGTIARSTSRRRASTHADRNATRPARPAPARRSTSASAA